MKIVVVKSPKMLSGIFRLIFGIKRRAVGVDGSSFRGGVLLRLIVKERPPAFTEKFM